MRTKFFGAGSPAAAMFHPVMILAIALLVAGLLLTGCSKKPATSTPAAQPTNVVEQTERESPAEGILTAPRVFPDAARQQQFETLFMQYAEGFESPQRSSPLRVYKTNGRRVEGEFMRYTADGLMLSTQDGLIPVARSDMAPVTLQSVFVDAFSRKLAEDRVNQTGASAATAGDLNALFLNADATQVTETRRFTADHMNTRLGPGRYFKSIPEVEIFRGQQVYVVGETNGWICVKGSPDGERVLGWIPKYASFVLNPENASVIKREVDLLMENGFLIDVNPARNEALVDLYEWRIADSASIEGKSRLLAYYCGQKKGSRLFWVNIKDALSGRRLADYSESKGFKVY